MSDSKKEKKLPGKDYFHNYKGDPDVKKHKREITDTQKLEFAAAFSDEEEDVKTYTPAPKQNPVKKKAETAPVSREELYRLPEFDSDEFFTSLGIPVPEKETNKKADEVKEEKVTKADVKSDEEKIEETRAFSKEEFVQVYEEKEPSKPVKKESLSDTLTNTIHFNLRSKIKGASQNKGKKNLMQNFRVLSKNREDRTILEAAPVGNGGKAFADSVKAKKGEDIFEAVEKAYLNKGEADGTGADRKAIRKERYEKGVLKGEEIKRQTLKQTQEHKKGMIIYGALFVISALLTLLFSDTVFYGYASLVISVAACAFSFPLFKNSFNAIKGLSAVSDTALAVMSFFVLIHNICVVALGHRVSVYTLCVVFALFMRICSGYFRLKSRTRAVSMALKSKSLSIMQRIPVKNDAVTFATKNAGDDEPDIFYCAEAYLDTSVDEPEKEIPKENRYYILTMSAVLIGGLIVGAFSFLTKFAGLSFITALTATVCALMPVMYDPMSRMNFYVNGKDMLKQGACISGREALTHIGKTDGFVLDAKDVFSGDVTRFRKSAISDISQTDSAVFAALLMREADSVLAPCFDEFLSQIKVKLPAVENFLYEERLGYSAWVLDRKILVGNRNMLVNHSITVPSKEHEKAYGKGRHVMYVVIDGEITATFLVRYKVLSSLKKYSRDFNKTGLVIMLSSKEAFLDEESVASMLSLDASSVKVLSSKATAIMDKYNSDNEKQVPTGLLCSSKKRSMMHLIMGCYNANAADRLIMIMLLVGQLLGLLLLVLSPVLNMPVFMNPLTIVVLRILWGVIVNTVINRKK